ncbi:MAG: M48 family metalloprotease, partial [Gemmatimonadales bacterium]
AQSIGLYPDENLQNYVNGIGQKLAAGSERPDLPWSFQVVDDPSVNAFALPGGFIFVTRGILTTMNSEAELASVLGHEIGHVTAKHAVQQISRAQVAQLGLGVGMLLSEDIRRFGGLASTGLSLLFLKYGRDDERQADQLGFRYSLQEGYDVREMDDVFQTLQRVSATGGSEGRLPEWLSTHPFPESRIEDTRARLDTLRANLAGARVGRDVYLSHIDNVVYGPNPRQGYFEGSVFYLQELKFRMDFPEQWQYQNQAAAVIAASPEGDAVVELSFAGQGTPDQAARQFLSQQGVRPGQTSQNPVNGLPAVTSSFEAQTADGLLLRGVVTFLSYGGATYRILAYTPANRISAYQNAFLATVQSFEQVNDPEVLNVKPNRVQVVKLDRSMTLEEFNDRYPSTVPLETLAVINDVEPEGTFEAGASVKRVTDR